MTEPDNRLVIHYVLPVTEEGSCKRFVNKRGEISYYDVCAKCGLPLIYAVATESEKDYEEIKSNPDHPDYRTCT